LYVAIKTPVFRFDFVSANYCFAFILWKFTSYRNKTGNKMST
jgi:hypothetical protein